MKVFLLFLLSFLFVNCVPSTLYRVTEDCIKCLRRLRIYDEGALAEIQNREYVTLEWGLSFADDKTRLRNLDAQSSTVDCLNSYGKQAPQETTQNRIERQLQGKLQSYQTKCSDEIANYYDRDRNHWRREFCTAYHSQKLACIPMNEIIAEEKEFLFNSCPLEFEDNIY